MTSKVPVGITSAAGYGVTVASVITAALDYIGGDHTQPTKTTLLLGVVAGVSFLTTQVGRYVQAHAQAKVAPQVLAEKRLAAQEERWATNEPDIAQADYPPETPSWLDESPTPDGAIDSDPVLDDPTFESDDGPESLKKHSKLKG